MSAILIYFLHTLQHACQKLAVEKNLQWKVMSMNLRRGSGVRRKTCSVLTQYVKKHGTGYITTYILINISWLLIIFVTLLFSSHYDWRVEEKWQKLQIEVDQLCESLMLSLEISQTKTKTLLFGSTTSLEVGSFLIRPILISTNTIYTILNTVLHQCFKRVIAIAHQKGTDDSLKFIWWRWKSRPWKLQ